MSPSLLPCAILNIYSISPQTWLPALPNHCLLLVLKYAQQIRHVIFIDRCRTIPFRTSLKIFITTSFILDHTLSENEFERLLFFFSSKVPKENPFVFVDCKEVTGDWNNSFHNNHPSTVWISFSMLCVAV